MNRRNVFKALAIPFAATSSVAKPSETVNNIAPNKSLMEIAQEIVEARSRCFVLYVDIGNLSQEKAETYINSIREKIKSSGISEGVLVVPERHYPCRLEEYNKS